MTHPETDTRSIDDAVRADAEASGTVVPLLASSRAGVRTFPRLRLLDGVSEPVFVWGPSALEPLNAAAEAYLRHVGDGSSFSRTVFVDEDGQTVSAEAVPLQTRPDARRRHETLVLGAKGPRGEATWSRMAVRKTTEPGVSREPLMVVTVCDVTRERAAVEEASSISRITDGVDVHVYRGVIDRRTMTFRETFGNTAISGVIGGEPPADVDPDVLWRRLLDPQDAEQFERLHRRLALGHDTRVIYRMVGLDGVVRWVVDRAHVTSMTEDEVTVEGTVTDISGYKDTMRTLEQELSRARLTVTADPLTGLFERRFLLEQMSDVLQAAVWDASDVGVLMIDVDHIKRVNDAFGQAFGDRVLQRVSEVLLEAAGPGNLVCRWGGEEFVVLVPDCSTVHQLRRLADRLCRAVATERHDGTAFRVTVSIGAALAGQAGRGAEAILQSAERALAAAKRSGRNRVMLVSDKESELSLPAAPDLGEVARALAGAASLREGVSDEHMVEVAILASEIAHRLGLTSDATTRTRLGAWLHDVGKVAVSESILCKPGSLDDAELAEMRRHAEVGAAFVGEVPGLEAAGPGVLHHHEAWDGTGYPRGLAGVKIPIEARIIAAADTFSAITQDRCYQVARSPEAAAAELLAVAGRQLDPTVVDVLLQILVDTGRIDAHPASRDIDAHTI
jgi:diguanylate cyclase (GGDEF)-like protein